MDRTGSQCACRQPVNGTCSFPFFAPRQDKVFTLLLEAMPLGQTSPTYIFLIKDQEKTGQHLHREDLKDPTELGLRESSRGVEQRKRSSQGGSAPPSLGCSPHRQGELRGCAGTYKPDGAHRCEAPLLKVGHHGLDNKKSVILEISLEGFFNSLTLLLNSLPVPQESYDPFFTYLKTVLNVYSPLPDRRKCRVLFYYFTGGKTTMETSSLGSNLGP